MPASVYAGNAYLNHFLRGVTAPDAPEQVFVALHTEDPTLDGSSEVSTGAWPGYVRKDAAAGGALTTAFAAADNKVTTNAKQLLWAGMNGPEDVTVTHFSLWTDSDGGALLHVGPLVAERTLRPTDEMVIHIGQLLIQVD